MNEKKVVGRNVVVALGIISIVLFAAFAVAIANYSYKDSQIDSLVDQINSLNATYQSYVATHTHTNSEYDLLQSFLQSNKTDNTNKTNVYIPDFNVFGTEKIYSQPTFFRPEGVHFFIQNIGNGTATNVTIRVVWIIQDINQGTVVLDFGITNDVKDAEGYYNRMLQIYGADSAYARDAYDRLLAAQNAERNLKPAETQSYSLDYPIDLNTISGVENAELPTDIVALGNVTFTVNCAERIAETHVFT